jgi:hypothetical protein
MYTDASKVGWGITIFFGNGETHYLADAWHEPMSNINVAEASVVVFGLDFLQEIMGRIHSDMGQHKVLYLQIELLMDNTSAIGCFQKQSSKSFDLNSVVHSAVSHTMWKYISSIEYVNTKQNPADWLSRLMPKTFFTASRFAFDKATVPSPSTLGALGNQTLKRWAETNARKLDS